MTRPEFESSLATLRDNIVMAIERRELGVVEDGLDVYERLIEAVLDEQRNLEKIALPGMEGDLPLGREWEQILRDLHGIIDSVSASRSRLLWVDVLSWIRQVAVACAERGAIKALGSVLQLFESAWNQELASRNSDSTARQDALLLRLSELGGIYLQFSSLGIEDARRANVAYTKTFIHVVKVAVESPDPDAAQIAIKYFLRGNVSRGNIDSNVTAAGLLALNAWILYLIDRGRGDQSLVAVFQEIRQAFSRESSFLPMLEEYDDLSGKLGIQWWELNQRGPVSGGVIQIGDYALLALLLVAGQRMGHQAFDPSNESDVRSAQRLLAVVQRFQEGGFPRVREVLDLPSTDFSLLSERLSEVVEQSDAIVEETYSRLPLDPERLSSFKAAFRERLTSSRNSSLTAALLDDDHVNVPTEKANFGLDSLVPRWYFANTGVYADPSDLARDLADALIRGEEERILAATVGDPASAPPVELDALRGSLKKTLRDRNPAAVVIVTNSYQAHALLTGTTQSGDSQAGVAEGLGPIFRVFDERDPYVAVMSRGQTPRVSLARPEQEVPSDQVLPDLSVILGVSEVAPEDIDRLVRQEPRTRVDEARLRGSVRVRVLEHFDVSLTTKHAATVWSLPESTY